MIKHILDSMIIVVLALAVIMHVLRLMYAFFQPAFLKKYTFLHNPGKTLLVLYYLLVIVVSIYGIAYKIDRF